MPRQRVQSGGDHATVTLIAWGKAIDGGPGWPGNILAFEG
jgi:hypothetical protein